MNDTSRFKDVQSLSSDHQHTNSCMSNGIDSEKFLTTFRGEGDAVKAEAIQIREGEIR